MVVMSKSQHRISLLRPKSQQGNSPGLKMTDQSDSKLLTYSQIRYLVTRGKPWRLIFSESKSLAPTFYTPKDAVYADFGAWTSNETLSSFGGTGGAAIETKHSKQNITKSTSRKSAREETITTPYPPTAPRRYKSATNINHQSNSQASETPKPSISESTVFNEKYHLDPAKKHLSFGQAVKKITTSHEFHHFDDYTNHISHYRTTVTNRINQKFNEYHATGLQVIINSLSWVKTKKRIITGTAAWVGICRHAHTPVQANRQQATWASSAGAGPGLEIIFLLSQSVLLKPIYFSPGQTRSTPALLLASRNKMDRQLEMEVKTIRLLSAKVDSLSNSKLSTMPRPLAQGRMS